ncbi:MAG: hypothetical protein K5761_01560 [Clostridiales bacterium]|nr:hypothetical protein [Clostridiales bacterium]
MAQNVRTSSYRNSGYGGRSAYTRQSTAPKIKEMPSKRPALRLVKPPKLSTVQMKEQMTLSNKKALKVFVLTFVAVILLALSIFSRVQLDEINRDIASTEKKIEIANSKNVELNMKLNEMISIEKVEEYASNKLGMVKVQDYQVVYVDLSDDDRVLMAGGKETEDAKTVTRAADD